LKSYTKLVFGIEALGLPCLENNGLFLTERLPPRNRRQNILKLGAGATTLKPVMNGSEVRANIPADDRELAVVESIGLPLSSLSLGGKNTTGNPPKLIKVRT
jgi:hypothetical protein